MNLLGIAAEMKYRREERLGILCSGAEPTPEQQEIARREALEWLSVLRQQNQQTEN